MMKLSVGFKGDLREILRAESEAGALAVTQGVSSTASALKAAWRGQITGAGLGNRLGRTIRSQVYPKGQTSLNAAGLVWTKAPEIIDAHDTGPLIRSKDGFWLAIPLPAAGKSLRGGRITPGEWERRNGRRLRFIFRRGKAGLLVAEDTRVNTRGLAKAKRGKRRRDGILSGAQTVPIFVLVPQARLKKRLDLQHAADQAIAGLPQAIVSRWRAPK